MTRLCINRIYVHDKCHAVTLVSWIETFIFIRGVIGKVANSKRQQQLKEIVIALPALHHGDQQSCLQENSAMQYTRET